jgi:hypothetical protein
MYVLNRYYVIMFLLLLALPGSSNDADAEYFPDGIGSNWTYTGTGLTTDTSGMYMNMYSFNETVTVTGAGVFHSAINFSNGNTTTSENNYVLATPLNIASTHIVKVTTQTLPYVGQLTTTSTTDNTYAPPQLFFPAGLTQGNVESMSGVCTTVGNSVVSGIPAPPTPINNETSEEITITIVDTETVTVDAGTFSTIKLTKVLNVTEDGQTTPYTTTEWYADGVGLVKMESANMNRYLSSYSVNHAVYVAKISSLYETIQSAFDAAADNDTVKVRDMTITENPDLNLPVNITLSGGWNSAFTSTTGITTLHGTLNLAQGSLLVSNLIIY